MMSKLHSHPAPLLLPALTRYIFYLSSAIVPPDCELLATLFIQYTSYQYSRYLPCSTQLKMASSTLDDVSTLDALQERFQWLKQHERKYICCDYTAPSKYKDMEREDLEERLKCILKSRNQSLAELFGYAEKLGIHNSVMSTAAFIFDKYLSTIVPKYIKRDCYFDIDCTLISVASLLIAAKLLLGAWNTKLIVDSLGKYSRKVYEQDVDGMILKVVGWNIVYNPPISIIQDVLAVLPRPCEFEYHHQAFSMFETSILHEADRLTKLAALQYDFRISYGPVSIALAGLSIALENQPSTGIPIFALVTPITYVSLMIEKSGIDLSFDDEEAVQCRKDMLSHFFERKSSDTSSPKRDGADSPTAVVEMHKRRRVTKKRNSFVAMSA